MTGFIRLEFFNFYYDLFNTKNINNFYMHIMKKKHYNFVYSFNNAEYIFIIEKLEAKGL